MLCFLSTSAGVMGRQCFSCCRVVLLLLLMSREVHSLSVHIVNESPVHVVPGSTLLLRARIQQGPLEEVSMVTWEQEPEITEAAPTGVLASCPGKSFTCSGSRPNVLASVEQQEATLQVSGYKRVADGGVYTVTVTERAGTTATAYCVVREYEAVHHVSVSINVSHSSLVCGEAWGTDPHFSWLHERAPVSTAVGKVSKDGITLLVTMSPICGHFTCVVSNKLGYSSATYTADPCETEGSRGTTAVVVCLVLLLMIGAVLAFLLWRRRRQNQRAESLREPLDGYI
ncbi:hypothetical protein JOB18_024135 [Solea senegalensis]|uniref:Uncharacterized protein n=1 Tax=Solea senegalensis TaxID=28829 RepID=A0AAV6PD96_SOLSE|nr:hypothetical protein JOB18_024135 [Solea senegalensis]